MNIKTDRHGMRLLRIVLAALSASAFFGIAGAQEKNKETLPGIRLYAASFSWVTCGSLPGETVPNLGEHTHSGNVGNTNETPRASIYQNSREQPFRDCKTFIHRFDSDRRLHNLNKPNNLGLRPLFKNFL